MTAEERAHRFLLANEDVPMKCESALVSTIRDAADEAHIPEAVLDEIAELLRLGFIGDTDPCDGTEPDCFGCRAARVLKALGKDSLP